LGRNRKKSNQQLPKRVYENRGRFVFIDRVEGVQQKAIIIGKADMPLSEVWQAFRELTETHTDTLQFLVGKYTDSKEFLAKKTHVETGKTLDNLLSTPVDGKTFGAMKYRNITPGIIRKYLDYRNNVAGNRDITYLSSAWSWCYERDIVTIANPCKGVKKIKEESRTRYVTDEEYKIAYGLAGNYMQVAMELAVICRMRRGEVLDLRVKDIETEGLNTRRSKGSNSTLTLWNDRLEKAINQGLEGCLRVPEMPVINNGKGSQVAESAFKSAFQRLQAKFKAMGVEHFTFHDLKAKGVSDFEGGSKQLAAGHKTASMTAIYDRKRKEIKGTE
jgi:integrase